LAPLFQILLSEEAKEKQVKAGENFGRGAEKLPALMPEAKNHSQNKTRTKLAESFKTSADP
jgi:hypothetical protein